MSDNKECFFIAPIGDEGSDVRERSNKVMEYIVEDAVSDHGYSVMRADQMDQPGSITNQVIQKTVDSELVIADLTGHNPNVFYELAVRHATGEPYIQLINSNESIPFDVSDLRTITYGLEVDEADRAKGKIRRLLESLEDGEPEFDNPISESAEIQSLRESADPTDQNLAEVLDTMYKLDKKIDQLEKFIVNPDTKPKSVNNSIRSSKLEPLDKGEEAIYNIVNKYNNDNQESITKDELFSSAKRLGMNEDEIRRSLRDLMLNGYIYQVEDGAYNAI